MRINSNMVPNILAAIQQSETTLQTALEQVSTGKRVNLPSEDPAAAAAMVQNTLSAADAGQYTQNVSSTLSRLQTADSALSTVVSQLTQAVSLGTEGANGTNNSSNLQSIAVQVREFWRQWSRRPTFRTRESIYSAALLRIRSRIQPT